MATIGLIKNSSPNFIINGNFDFWQRGTSFTTPSSGAYTADRFTHFYDGSIGTFTISRQAFTLGQTDVPGEPTYFYRWAQTVAGSGSTARQIQHKIESVRTLAGKQATLSFYAKADAARSVNVSFQQVFGSGGSPSSPVSTAAQTVNLTTSWKKFTLTFSIPSIAGKTLGTSSDYIRLILALPLNTTMTIDLAQVMLNEGAAPANFALAGEDVSGELALCQRYYEKSYRLDDAPGTAVLNGAHFETSPTTTNVTYHVYFRVLKRTSNYTFLTYNTATGASGSGRDITAGTNIACARTNDPSESGDSVIFTGTTVSGNRVAFHWTADAEL
jgi:hypothetical protein